MVARLPQLSHFDGREVTRTERISAAQELPRLAQELAPRAAARAAERAAAAAAAAAAGPRQKVPDDEPQAYTPEVRTEMYREMAEQKAGAAAATGAPPPLHSPPRRRRSKRRTSAHWSRQCATTRRSTRRV